MDRKIAGTVKYRNFPSTRVRSVSGTTETCHFYYCSIVPGNPGYAKRTPFRPEMDGGTADLL
eukprot:1045203-Rhodomonas_salina.1